MPRPPAPVASASLERIPPSLALPPAPAVLPAATLLLWAQHHPAPAATVRRASILPWWAPRHPAPAAVVLPAPTLLWRGQARAPTVLPAPTLPPWAQHRPAPAAAVPQVILFCGGRKLVQQLFCGHLFFRGGRHVIQHLQQLSGQHLLFGGGCKLMHQVLCRHVLCRGGWVQHLPPPAAAVRMAPIHSMARAVVRAGARPGTHARLV